MKHADEERIAWEEEFSLNWRKDRSIYYPKKKKGYSGEGSDTSMEEKPHNGYNGKKPQQKYNKGHKKPNNNYNNNYQNNTQHQKKNTNNYEDYRSKENFENFSQKKNLDFFEYESAAESKFLKFFSNETSNENLVRNTYNNAEDSSKNVYKYFPNKENQQPLMEIQNFFANTTSSNNHNMEGPVKRVGFHNEKKGSQNMRYQNQQNKHIEVK